VKWLITVASRAELDQVVLALASSECRPTGDPIPFENGEQVIPAAGPGDLPQRLREVPGVLKVSASSEMTYY
jgi:hypothetical protein